MANGQDKPTSFAKALFHGRIYEDMVFPYPSMDKEEASTIDIFCEAIDRFFTDNVDPGAIDKNHKIPKEVMDGIAELGLFGCVVPQEYGGAGLSMTGYARAIQTLAKYDASIATMLMAHQSIGLKGIIMYGTEEQKKRLLPDLASGKKLAGFALTEPTSGSDAFSIKTRAVKDGDNWILNGGKIWITNGGTGHTFTVFAKTELDVDGGKKDKISAFIVEKGMEGFTSGPEEEKIGIRGSSTTSLYFDNVKIPKENVLGEIGRGFKYAMEILNTGRLGLAAGSVGGCRMMVSICIQEAVRRKQFNRPIISFGMIKQKLAHMTMDTYALESATFLTTGLMDAGVQDYSLESAICKILGADAIWDVVDETIQIHGGNGYMTDLPYARVLRDARIFRIFEGTNEILHLFIALAGMQSPGEELKEVAKAMKAPIKSLGVLSDFAIKWVKRRSIGGDTITKAHPLLKREATQIEDFTLALSKTVEALLLKHGKEIIEKQFAQHRIAKWVINLYIMIAVVSRATRMLDEQGVKKADTHLKMARAICAKSANKIRREMKGMDKNSDELHKELIDIAQEAGGYPVGVHV